MMMTMMRRIYHFILGTSQVSGAVITDPFLP